MDEERMGYERDYYHIPLEVKKNYNYRLMKEDEIPSWFIETVSSNLFSQRIWMRIRSTDGATGCGNR